MATKRVALVTGAGTGIGKAAALALLKDGYHVALVGRRGELLQKTAAESAAGERAMVLATRPYSVAYTSTKHAVTGLTKCISLDGRKDDIVGSQIDIGNAATEMTERMTKGVPQPNGTTMVEPRMDVKHVGSAVLYMANLPLDANV